jgi:hypothetical protein
VPAAQNGEGVIVNRPDLTILDTREMVWEENSSRLGSSHSRVHGGRKVLDRDEHGEPAVMLNHMPAGFTVPDLPYRHYHSTVHEFAFFLGGESWVWEYEDAEQQNGQFVIKRAGYFMDRSPGSIQGLEPGPTTPVGAHILVWRTGSGTEMGERDFETETIHVSYSPGWEPKLDVVDVSTSQQGRETVIGRSDLTVLDTRAMQWESVAGWGDIPGLQGVKRKVLTRDEQGLPSVFLSYLPAGFSVPDLPFRHYHSTVHEYAFFLEGELPQWEYENAEQQRGDLVTYKPGYFMHRRPGSIHGFEPGPTTPVGALMLAWRTGHGTELGESGFEVETIEVPYV